MLECRQQLRFIMKSGKGGRKEVWCAGSLCQC